MAASALLKAPSRSNARTALAETIAALREEQLREDNLKKAIAAAERLIEETLGRLVLADAAIEPAKAAQTERMLAAASSGGEFKDDGLLARARSAAIQAADEVVSAKDAALALRNQMSPKNYLGETEVDKSRKRLVGATAAVLRDETDIEALLAATEAAEKTLVDRRAVLAYLVLEDLVAAPYRRRVQDMLCDRSAHQFLPSIMAAGQVQGDEPWPTTTRSSGFRKKGSNLIDDVFEADRPWRAAREKLALDPDAAVPAP